MKVSLKDCFGELKRRRYIMYCFIIILAALAALTAGLGMTKEKVQKVEIHKINENDVRIKNIGCQEEVLNPLRQDEHPEINSAVKDYFDSVKKDETFVEKYDKFHIFTKLGQYRDTYVVFVKYCMKIKDIYTEVPGLATLYAVRDEKGGQYRILTEPPEGQDKEYVDLLTEHTDIKQMLENAEQEFDLALRSDAILRESLDDLKNAYSVSAG